MSTMISSHWDSRVSALRNLRRYCLASSKLMEKVQKGLFFVLLALFNSSLYKGVTLKGKQSMQKNFFSSIISADKRSVQLIWKQPFLPSCKQFIFPKNCNLYYSKTSRYILYIVVVLILQHYQLPLGCAMFALADILLCW